MSDIIVTCYGFNGSPGPGGPLCTALKAVGKVVFDTPLAHSGFGPVIGDARSLAATVTTASSWGVAHRSDPRVTVIAFSKAMLAALEASYRRMPGMENVDQIVGVAGIVNGSEPLLNAGLSRLAAWFSSPWAGVRALTDINPHSSVVKDAQAFVNGSDLHIPIHSFPADARRRGHPGSDGVLELRDQLLPERPGFFNHEPLRGTDHRSIIRDPRIYAAIDQLTPRLVPVHATPPHAG